MLATASVALVAMVAFVFLNLSVRALRDDYQRLADLYASEREERREERRTLLNRIQAPQLAAYEASGEPSEEPLYVPYDDDAAHDKYVEERLAGRVS